MPTGPLQPSVLWWNQISSVALTVSHNLALFLCTADKEDQCPLWVSFGPSCYYISSEAKTWEESRKDCQRRNSDLVIINSDEEQVRDNNKYLALISGKSTKVLGLERQCILTHTQAYFFSIMILLFCFCFGQKFIMSLGKKVWLGLTDQDEENVWKWVDGTTLAKRYWNTNAK